MALALLLALGACTSTAPGTPAEPELSDVPAMPRLTYSLEQRQAIGNALLADRAHASYAGAQLRARSGQAGAVPPQPPALATMPPLPPRGAAPDTGPNAETAYVREQVRNETDDGSLSTFMRKLAHGEPPAVEPVPAEPEPAARATGSPPEAAAPKPPAPPKTEKAAKADVPGSSGLDPLVSYLGGLLGMDPFPARAAAAGGAPHALTPAPGGAQRPPPPPAAAPSPPSAAPPPPAPPLATMSSLQPAPDRLPLSVIAGREPAARLRLAEGGAVPGDAARQLGALVGQARALDAGLRIVGQASSPSRGLDRARAVAQTLVGLGAPADRLLVEPGGPGEETLVYLAPHGAS